MDLINKIEKNKNSFNRINNSIVFLNWVKEIFYFLTKVKHSKDKIIKQGIWFNSTSICLTCAPSVN